MNKVNVIIQSKDDPKTLLNSIEKVQKWDEGVSIIFIEDGTEGGQLGIQLVIKGSDFAGRKTLVTAGVTERNFEGIVGAFIGSRARFGRMIKHEFELVDNYVEFVVSQITCEMLPDHLKIHCSDSIHDVASETLNFIKEQIRKGIKK